MQFAVERKKMEFKPPLIIKTSLDISSFFWYVTCGTVLDDSVVIESIFSLLRLSWRASNPAEKRPNTRLIAGMTVRERFFGLMAFCVLMAFSLGCDSVKVCFFKANAILKLFF